MRLTEKVHQILANQLKAGDLAIDATAGNGYDTLFLAEKVGPSGAVISVDIQAAAIESTEKRIAEAGLQTQTKFHVGDHSKLLNEFVDTHEAKAAAITFNLGYLPGSDHNIQTKALSTLPALDAALKLLKTGGLLCVTAYSGHAGGQEEANLVEKWMHEQEESGHSVECYIPESQNNPPILWVLKKD
jgi:ubiquinone/menaquinone biosynthesis C-methylase UbiE